MIHSNHNGYPLAQGFYLRLGGEWVRALGVPVLHLRGDAGKGILMRDLVYIDEHGIPHFVGRGFPFDGISIPRALWRVAGHPWGGYLLAAVIHDAETADAQALPPGPARAALRLIADQGFPVMLHYLDAPRCVPAIWYGCVRAGSLGPARWRAACPDWRKDLRAYYQYEGVGLDVLDVVLA